MVGPVDSGFVIPFFTGGILFSGGGIVKAGDTMGGGLDGLGLGMVVFSWAKVGWVS